MRTSGPSVGGDGDDCVEKKEFGLLLKNLVVLNQLFKVNGLRESTARLLRVPCSFTDQAKIFPRSFMEKHQVFDDVDTADDRRMDLGEFTSGLAKLGMRL